MNDVSVRRTIIKKYTEKLVYLTPPHAPSLVSTIGPVGNYNLAPFEQTMTCSNFPPCILLAITPKCDTLKNILKNHEFALGFPTPKIIDQVLAAGTKLPPEENEFELTGLTPIPSEIIKPPRIAECQVNFECVLQWAKEAGDHWVIVGQVVLIDVLTDLLREDKIERRCGLDAIYYATSGVFITKGERLIANCDEYVKRYEDRKRNG